MSNGNGGISEVTFRWIMGGAAAGAVIYGGFLLGAVHDVRDEVEKLSAQIYPRETHARMWAENDKAIDRLENEMRMMDTRKADKEAIVHDQEALRQKIQELDAHLGYGGDNNNIYYQQRKKR